MKLPIEYPRPWKHKYLDEETPMFARWFVFGTNQDKSRVCISDGNGDIISGLPAEKADRLIESRDRFVDDMLAVLKDETGG